MNLVKRGFTNYWSPYWVMSIAGLLSAIYFGLTKTVWAVTGEFTRLGGHLLQFLGVDVSDWTYFKLIGLKGNTFSRTDGWIIWGMFIGALITVLLSNGFKIRIPKQKRRLLQGLVGGIIAGFGARMALGCNLAAFFTGVPQFSFHAWIFMLTTAVGTYFGFKVVSTKWWKGKPVLTKGNPVKVVAKKSSRQVYVGLSIAVLYSILVLYFAISGKTLLAVAAVFGAAFGILIERGQICFTSAFRDLWVSGRTLMTKAICIGMAVSTVACFVLFTFFDYMPVTKIAAFSTVIGGLLFGFGIVLAGGCETGMMYRMMEGQVLYLFVFIGNLIGVTLLSYGWDHWGIYDNLVKVGTPINLFTKFGPGLALTMTLAMLAIWYFGANYWGKNYKFGTGFKKR